MSQLWSKTLFRVESPARLRARLGLQAAVDRVWDGLTYNGLTLGTDERRLVGVLDGSVSSVELAETICSSRRKGLLPRAPITH